MENCLFKIGLIVFIKFKNICLLFFKIKRLFSYSKSFKRGYIKQMTCPKINIKKK